MKEYHKIKEQREAEEKAKVFEIDNHHQHKCVLVKSKRRRRRKVKTTEHSTTQSST